MAPTRCPLWHLAAVGTLLVLSTASLNAHPPGGAFLAPRELLPNNLEMAASALSESLFGTLAPEFVPETAPVAAASNSITAGQVRTATVADTTSLPRPITVQVPESIATAPVALPSCHLGRNSACPGVYADSGSCNTGLLYAQAQTAIGDAGLLTGAALAAISQNAPHYAYFFSQNNGAVRTFVQTVFENMQACAAGRNNCAFTSVFCQTDPTRGYNWCPYNNGTVASFVPDPKGSAYMCPLGLTLPRNPVPCSTPGGEQSLGYALLRSLVQIYEVGNPKSPPNFFEKVGITGIRDLEQNRGVWNVSRLGGGEDGLGTDGVGNAENYAKFASLSWDYGYGGTPCPERWDEYAAANNLVPV